jgi:hypothetical protein
MSSTSDDSDPEEPDTICSASRLRNERRNPEFPASDRLSLLEVTRVPVRWRKARTRLLVIDGRRRSLSRARASGSHDRQLRRRRRSVSPTSRAAHFPPAGLLQAPLRTNRSRSDGGGGPPAGDSHRVHAHRQTYERWQPFTPWIQATARYKFLGYLRRTKWTFKDLPLESAHELTSVTEITASDSGLDLQRRLSEISSKARQAIQHVKLKALSVSEAAARSRMSESVVEVAVHRGLRALVLRIRARK